MTVVDQAGPERMDLLQPRTAISFPDERFLMFMLDEMAAELERRHDDVIRLTLGKAELPPSEPVVSAMVAAITDHALASQVHPGGLPALRERLSVEYERRYGVRLPAHRFVVNSGTSAIVRNLHQLLAGHGDEVLVPLPYYPLYTFTARLAGATVRHYRIDLATMSVDFDSLADAITEATRIVVVNSPGNPLGNIVDRASFRRIDQIVAGRAVLLSDEIYGNVLFGPAPFSAVELMDELQGPLVVTNGFSKAHRMYARRVGYAILPDELVQPMEVVQHHTLLTADPVAQTGAIAAMDDQRGVAELADRYRSRRDYTLHRFAAVPGVTALPAQDGFYLTLDCTEQLRRTGLANAFELAIRILATVRVATVPGSDFGLPGTLRLSYSAHHYHQAIDRLVDFFAGPVSEISGT